MPIGFAGGSGFGCGESKVEEENCFVNGAGVKGDLCAEAVYVEEGTAPPNADRRRLAAFNPLGKPSTRKPQATRRQTRRLSLPPLWHIALACCGGSAVERDRGLPSKPRKKEEEEEEEDEEGEDTDRATHHSEEAGVMAAPAVLRASRRVGLPSMRSASDERSVVVDKARALLQLGMITESEYLEVVVADRIYRIHSEPPSGSRMHCKALKRQQRMAMVAQANQHRQRATAAAAEAAPPPDPDQRDPITLEPLGAYRLTFRFEADGSVVSLPSDIHRRASADANARTVTYNTDSLARYLIETGNFIEPTTRAPLGAQDVAILSEQLERMGLLSTRDQLAEAYRQPDTYKSARERADLLEGLDRCVGDVVSEMLGLIDGVAQQQAEGRRRGAQRNGEAGNANSAALWPEVRLVVQFAHFDHFFGLLMESDPGYALQCLDQYSRHLRGPPNKRTRDAGGLLSACLSHLREKEREAAHARRKQLRRRQQQQR